MAGKKKLKFALLGCGRQAWLGYLPWIKENPDAELVALADIDEELLSKTARKYGGVKYTDYEQMVEQGGADALIITTPPWVHADPAVCAAEAGLHVLCEKPMASTVEDCERMVRAGEENHVQMIIAHSLRFDPGYEKLKCMIATGEIGEVFQLRGTYDAWVPDLEAWPFREIMDIGGRMRLFGTKDLGAWRVNDERTNGGSFFDHGIHYIDLFRWFMGQEAEIVGGIVQKVVKSRVYEDHGSAMMRFESGACAYVQSSLCRFSARAGDCDEGLIHGSKGCIKYEMDQDWYIKGFPTLNNSHAHLWKFGIPSFIVNRWMPVHVNHGRKYCLFNRQFDHFVSLVNGTLEPHPVIGTNWAATARDGMKAVKMVHEVYRRSQDAACAGE